VKNTGGGVTITILGKELMVACPDEERAALVAAARELDQRMREIQDGGKVIGGERVAVMAALNLSNELLQIRRQAGSLPDGLDGRLVALTTKIEAILHE
jgi:cell division protein ZapA